MPIIIYVFRDGLVEKFRPGNIFHSGHKPIKEYRTSYYLLVSTLKLIIYAEKEHRLQYLILFLSLNYKFVKILNAIIINHNIIK